MNNNHVTTSESRETLLGRAANEFFEAAARGEKPSIHDFAARYPLIADDIQRTFAAVAMIGDSMSAMDVAEPQQSLSRAQQLGDFRIVREIGRGGMGVVYEAEQLSMERRVALKVLPFATLAGEKSLKRFQNEVRAAATLDHPHIVSVYSVGEERSIHFYAMQLVRGQSLAEVIEQLRAENRVVSLSSIATHNSPVPADAAEEQRNSSNPGRLAESTLRNEALTAVRSTDRHEYYRRVAQLGMQAAEALQHAHERGIVHRDIKPANLLLDAAGQLRITDFGLASIESDVNLTMTGELIGTLRYMSPEQALGRRALQDHRTDIYSLGATLYELLTLRPVFDGDDRETLIQQITHDKPLSPRRIDRKISADMETILLKTLEQEPSERYASAGELADDLRFFLDDRPIKAKPATVVQKLGKWSRRHRPLVASAAVMSVILVIASMTSTALIWREMKKTERAAAGSKAVVDFLVNDLLAAAEPERSKGREVTVIEVLARAEDKIDSAFQDQPLVEASVRSAMGSAYQAIGQNAKATQHHSQALELRKAALGPEHPDTLASMHNLAVMLMEQGQLQEARQLFEETLELRRRILGPEHPVTLTSMGNLANVLMGQGKLEEARQLNEETLELMRRIKGPEHPDTLASMNNQALVLLGQGELGEARQLYEETLELKRRILGTEHPDTLTSMNNLARVLSSQGKLEEARQLHEETLELNRRILGPEHPDTLNSMNNLATVLSRQGKFEEARQLHEETLELTRRILGTEHPHTLNSMNNLANVLWNQGKSEEARQLYEESLELKRRILGTEHPDTLTSMNNLARVLSSQGKLEEARQLHEETLELKRRILGPAHPDIETTLGALFYCSQVDYLPRAKAYYDEALKMELDKYGKRYISKIHTMRGRISWYLEDYENALADFESAIVLDPGYYYAPKWLSFALATCPEIELRDARRAIQLGEVAVKLHPRYYDSWVSLGAAHYLAGDFAAAVSALKKGLELTPGSSDTWAGFYLAMAQWQLDQKDEAREWYRKAADRMKAEAPIYQAEVCRLRDQAAELLGTKNRLPTEETEAASR